MHNWRYLVCFCACALSLGGLSGCWFGKLDRPPEAQLSPTQNPLVAQYTLRGVRTGVTAWVEFGPDTNYGRETWKVTTSTTDHLGEIVNILVAGMKAQTTYHMRAHLESASTSWVDQDRTFTTGALAEPAGYLAGLPFQLPSFSVAKPPSSVTPAPGVELLSLTGPPNISSLECLVLDLQGNIIWFYPPTAFPIKLMDNGHFILQMNTDLREVDLAGDIVRDVSVAQVNQSLQASGYSFVVTTFSHDILTLPNGHWITIGQISKSFDNLPGYPGTTDVLGDALIDIDPNGNVVWGWSAFDYLDVNRHLQGLPDWTHSNGLVYTPDGNLLLSMRHQSWILKIDYANGTGTGNILWKLGEDGDFGLAGGDPTQWFYAQHDPVLENTNGSLMTLAVYDDGNYRIDSAGVACGTSPTAPACYSRAAIFQIDEDTHNASLLWQYLPGFYSYWGGSIGTLSNGNIEFDSTDPFNIPLSEIMEVTNTDTPQMVWQMNINGQYAYRGSRIPSLYPGVTWQQ
ncbi:MAG TPA: aryl-sulfate sulfotransferase [Candidatus Sulfotelmatobacter sp.]|nr:aryl-sulfate sulfotransferase [Candidatus Sulfotelmatobacter sp.]